MIENRRVVLRSYTDTNRVMFPINPSAGCSRPIPCPEKPLQNSNPLPGIDRGAVIVIDKPGWLDHHQRPNHKASSWHLPHNITGSILLYRKTWYICWVKLNKHRSMLCLLAMFSIPLIPRVRWVANGVQSQKQRKTRVQELGIARAKQFEVCPSTEAFKKMSTSKSAIKM